MRSTYVFITHVFLCTVLFFSFCSTAKNYVQLHDELHNIAACVFAAIAFDNHEDSPLQSLKRSIENGEAIQSRDKVIQALEYSQRLLEHSNSDNITRKQLLCAINNIMQAIKKGYLGDDLLLLDIDDDTEAEVTRLTVATNIFMSNSDSAEVGNILKDGVRFINNFGTNNTFVGIRSGSRFAGTGGQNTGLGVDTLRKVTTGSGNTAVGIFALSSNTRGMNNVAVGFNALNLNRRGSNNVAIGFGCLRNSQNSNDNIAIGDSALFGGVANENGENIALGNDSLVALTSGSRNIGIGQNALAFHSGGLSNIFIGCAELNSPSLIVTNNFIAIGHQLSLRAGDNDILIGNKSGSFIQEGNINNIMIHNFGAIKDSDVIRIGTNQIKTFIEGIFNSNVSGSQLFIAADGQLGVKISQRSDSNNMCSINKSNSMSVDDLNPVTFIYNDDETKTRQYGLIAEEVGENFPELVINDEYNEPLTVHYEMLPALLLAEMKQLQQDSHEIVQLQKDIIQLQKKIDYLRGCNQ